MLGYRDLVVCAAILVLGAFGCSRGVSGSGSGSRSGVEAPRPEAATRADGRVDGTHGDGSSEQRGAGVAASATATATAGVRARGGEGNGDVNADGAWAPNDWPYRAPAMATSTRGMVVSDHAVASEVGRDMLRSGGNAVDAAVAMAFALAVAYPTAGNIGGGGFAVARVNGVVKALDFRETAPGLARADMYRDERAKGGERGERGGGGGEADGSRDGARAAGVPGSVAGLWELHRALGSTRKTWAEVVAPAVRIAREGVRVDEAFRGSIAAEAHRLARFGSSAALFLPDGVPPAQGSVWRNPELGATLDRIAKEGAKGFYGGKTARAIVGQMQAGGGLISLADLGAYRARWRTPLEFTYRGARILTMPPPSSGGVTLAMVCHIVEGFDLRRLGFQSAAELHVVVEAMRRAFAARNAWLGDPDYVTLPMDRLLSEAWAAEQRAGIQRDRATPSSEVVTDGAPSGLGPHTTHLAAVDGDGNAVALTTTLNWWFGSGVTVKGAGFVLNNEMDDFATAPGKPNGFGLVQGEANAIAPGKRMLSSMSPTLVTSAAGDLILVAGAAGGPTIITSVFEEISNVLDFGLTPERAVAAPRYHMQHLPDVVVLESGGFRGDTQRELVGMGYRVEERAAIADAPAIGRGHDGVWVGVADPRRSSARAAPPSP